MESESVLVSIVMFVAGIALLVFSAEKLISYLVGVASRWMISLFLIAVIFTGIEFDDLAFGIVLNLEDLSEVALGTVMGTTTAMTGIVLAVAAIVAPCRVDVPRDYLVLFVAAPLVMVAFAAFGEIGFVSGLALVALFVAFVGYVAYREYTRARPVFRNAEVYEQLELAGVGGRGGTGTADGPDDTATPTSSRPPSGGGFTPPPDLRIDQGFLAARRYSPGVALTLALVALVGLVVGALLAGEGTEGIVEGFDIDGTLFGITVATLVLTLEDLFLTVEPARRGAPEIGVANVIGSVVFSVTGKLGIIVLAGGAILVDGDAFYWHLPVLVISTVLAAGFLATGHLRRWHGYVLLGLFVVYFFVSIFVFGEAPVQDD